ncbi:hypothetical protein ACWD25_28965 [Streptomyces sp. NPDC002920]
MAYLEITLQVAQANRSAAAGMYEKCKQPFLDTVPRATTKELLVRDLLQAAPEVRLYDIA